MSGEWISPLNRSTAHINGTRIIPDLIQIGEFIQDNIISLVNHSIFPYLLLPLPVMMAPEENQLTKL